MIFEEIQLDEFKFMIFKNIHSFCYSLSFKREKDIVKEEEFNYVQKEKERTINIHYKKIRKEEKKGKIQKNLKFEFEIKK